MIKRTDNGIVRLCLKQVSINSAKMGVLIKDMNEKKTSLKLAETDTDDYHWEQFAHVQETARKLRRQLDKDHEQFKALLADSKQLLMKELSIPTEKQSPEDVK